MMCYTKILFKPEIQPPQSAGRPRIYLRAARATLPVRLSAHTPAAVRRAHQSRLPRDAGGARARLPGRLPGELDAGRQTAGASRGGQCGLSQGRPRSVSTVHSVGGDGEHRSVRVYSAQSRGHRPHDGVRECAGDRSGKVCTGSETGAAAVGL